MRTIKFRGQKPNNEWLYGNLIHNQQDYFIFPVEAPNSYDYYRVSVETVGQFTGLTDRNGVEIYENDIIYFLIDNEKYAVEFHEGAFCLVSENINVSISMYDFDNSEYEVIGNIHDTPELL